MVKITAFDVHRYTEPQIKKHIKECAALGHFQQVSYSVHKSCLTQICFGCQKVRTSLKGKL